MVLDEDNDFGLEDCARLRVERQNGVLGKIELSFKLSGLVFFITSRGRPPTVQHCT